MRNIIDVKKDSWTEEEIFALPSGEPDKFDRKSGMLLSDFGFEEKIAKALSAFSNSGGGHLIIGVNDDGTIDGVSEFHKGKTKTREWLEQKIPYLLTPPLQDFRVHEVEKSSQTLIPQDKVIIVIDVGDSNLAPHQSSKDRHYYHRSGGHSKPASHQHLEFLWKREIYPGPRIVSAWVYKVINPFLNVLRMEIQYVQAKKWGFDRYYQESSKGLQKIYQNYNSGNYEQFFDHYPKIYDLIQKHDEEVSVFINKLASHYVAIKDCQAIQQIFDFTTSAESLERLRDEKYDDWNYKIRECKTQDSIYKEIFSHLDKPQILEFLAQLIINGDSKIVENNFAPYWNVHSENFLSLYLASCEEKTLFEKSRDRLLEITIEIIDVLKQERKFLCSKYQIPFEENQQVFIQTSGYQQFRGVK